MTVSDKAARRPLDEITLIGYKSIRELKAFRLEKGLNVLIGANGSGKTNFIRFFELLGHLADPNKGLQNYVRARGGADAFLFRGMKVTPELQALLRFGESGYKFTLKGADDRSLFFAKESTALMGLLDSPLEEILTSGHQEKYTGSQDSADGRSTGVRRDPRLVNLPF